MSDKKPITSFAELRKLLAEETKGRQPDQAQHELSSAHETPRPHTAQPGPEPEIRAKAQDSVPESGQIVPPENESTAILKELGDVARSLELLGEHSEAEEAAVVAEEFESRELRLQLAEDELDAIRRDLSKITEGALGSHQQELESLRTKLLSARDKARSLRREKRALDKEIAEASKLNKRSRRTIRNLEKRLADATTFGHITEWILKDKLFSGRDLFPDMLATLGSGSFQEAEFDAMLQEFGFDLVFPGDKSVSEEVEVMVLGREGWDEESIESQLAGREGKILRVYSQEMFIASLVSGLDFLQELGVGQLLGIAKEHLALEFLINSDLNWPETSVASLPTEYRPFDADGQVDRSPLKELSYTVGITHGLPARERREILSSAFLGDLPWVHSDEYMSEWGRNATRRRLWRISHHLSWLARTWKHSPNHTEAVKDWVSDLEYLRKKYYKPWMRFKWPKVQVPGGKGR